MATGRILTVGTRGSRLALRQTALVVDELRVHHPELQFEVRKVRTEGDRRSQASLSQIGGQGVFVKELEAALLRGEVDLAVHSLKDMPPDLASGLTVAAIPQRADPRDALVSRGGATIATLPEGARVGTGSARRAVQLRALRADLEPVDIRGNVETRIRKVDEGEVEAVLLAAAGLGRLGLLDRAAELLAPDRMLSAVGQGAIAVQVRAGDARAGDAELIELLAAIDHRESRLACESERAFLARLGGGCRLPFGALAEIEGGTLRARGFISDAEGTRAFRAEISGPAEEAESIGIELAERLLAQGAAAFVEAETT